MSSSEHERPGAAGRQATRRILLLGGISGAAVWGVPDAAWAANVDRSVASRYRFPTPNNAIDTGGAIIGINGPMAEVYRVVTMYRRYKEILPRVSMSKIMGRKGKSVDVYLRAPIMGGVNHVWGVARITPYPWRSQGKKVVARYRKGNLDGFRAVWKMYPCGPRRTVVRFELFLDPKIPVPAALVTPELAWAADKAVTAVRDMVECHRSTVKDD